MTETAPTPAEAVPNEPAPSAALGSLLILTAQVLGNLGFFVAVLLLARGLSTAERGTVAFATTVALIVPRVSELGTGSATTVLAARSPAARGSLLTNAVATACAVGVAGATVAALVLGVGGVGPNLGRGVLVCLGLGVLANALLDAAYAFLVGIGRLGGWTIVAGSAPWLYAAALGGLWAGGALTVEHALLAWALAHLLWGIAGVAVAARLAGVGPFHPALLAESFRLGTRAWVGSLSRFLNFRLDQVVLGLIAAQATLGIYATAVNLSEIALYLPGAVATITIATIARAEGERRRAQTLRTFRVLLALTLPVVLVGAIVGWPLLPVLFGSAYEPSVTPYLVLLPGALGYVASGVFSGALVSSTRPVLSSLGPLVSLVVGLGLDLALIPPYGATGAAVAATAAFAAGGLAALLAYRSLEPFPASALVPHRGDTELLADLVRRAGRRVAR